MNRYYIGSAKNFDARFEKHQTHYFGHQKFTSKADDWDIFLVIECNTESQSRQIESLIKKMKSKKYIQNLKMYPEMIQQLLENIKTVNHAPIAIGAGSSPIAIGTGGGAKSRSNAALSI